MSRRIAFLACLGLVCTGLVFGEPTAHAAPVGFLDEAAAMAQARATGVPVVVSARTDETTLITADPATGLFTAELSARPARVRDGAGGWREPSARLVRAADGSWQTEAGVAQVRVSAGGASGTVATLADGAVTAGLSWPEVLPVPVVDGSTATYPEVWPGVDLVVRADVDAVESYLVVKTAQAGRNPKVRDWSMPISTPGLTVSPLEGGGKALVDAGGARRMVVPPAMMWDSTGKPSVSLQAADRVDPGLQSKAAPVAVKVASGKLTASSDQSFLDDPDTVYPVVIDPVLQLADDLNHVLRVTTDGWTKWDSAVGSRGKIGYNGWTSPYYKSRMFYQIKWPTVLAPEQISKGVFQYVQTHSPQHSPCKSSSTSYPTERAKLATAISSSDTWSDRTEAGDGWHPQPSVLPVTRVAVGHEDYCQAVALEEWDLTSAIKTERATYPTRTTVTIGIYSDEESNKMGWKEYYNNYGTSPMLKLSYQQRPEVPATPILSPLKQAGVTWSPTPRLQSQVSLADTDRCVTTSCMVAEFVVSGGGQEKTYTSSAVASGGTASVQLSALADHTTYTVKVRSYSLDVASSPRLYSAYTSTISFTTDLLPGVASDLRLTNDGSVAVGSPPLVTTPWPGLAARMPTGSVCPGETPACLLATFEVRSSSSTLYSVSASARPGEEVLVTPPVDIANGAYTLVVRVKNAVTLKTGADSTLQFVSKAAPRTPILSETPGLVSSVDGTQLSVRVTNAVPGLTYNWRTTFTPYGLLQQPSVVTVAGRVADANGNVTVGWTPAGAGTVQVQLQAVDSIDGVDVSSGWSTQDLSLNLFS